MNNWCRHCQWWDFSYENELRRFGKCSNMMVEDDLKLTEEGEMSDGSIFTFEYFGCVWFEKEDKVVVKIDPEKKL
jgi:hypothetical protein